MNTSRCLLLIVFSAVMFHSCSAGGFSQKSWSKCSYPNWKCDCKLYYNCDTDTGDTGFPDDDLGASPAGELKDLAPGDYPMQMPGKRWRRNVSNQRQFCKRECMRRMNAFLCFDDGDNTAYSRAAVCAKLQMQSVVAQTASADEPCCEIFLQWGPQWCDDRWYESIMSVICAGETTGFPTDTVIVSSSTCNPGDTSGANTWCTGSAPTCPTT